MMIAAAALQLAAYWPGILHNDSTMQYAQAITGHMTDWHPPLMTWIWQQLHKVYAGPAPMLLLQAILYWTGFALLARGAWIQEKRWHAFAIGACALMPLSLAWNGAVLKDALMAGALLTAAGLLAINQAKPKTSFRVIGIVMVLFAAAIRFNAFFGCLPLMVFLLPEAWRKTPLRAVTVTIVATLTLMLVPFATTKLVRAQPSGVELSLVIFDLGGITEESGVNVFPSANVADMVRKNHACYTPRFWDNYGWWIKDGRCALSFHVVRETLRTHHVSPYSVWLKAIAAHPIAYARHRWSHFEINTRFIARMGIKRPIWNEARTIFPYRPQPNYALSTIDWLAFRNAQIPLGWPACWMALAAGLLMIARDLPSRRIIVPLALSALTYGAGYLVISVASDLRYHMWTMMAASIAGMIALADVLETRSIDRRQITIAALPLLVVTLIAVMARLILPYGPPSA